MDMLPLDPIDLVAVDSARGIRRRWSLTAARDLFGQVVVETEWGRIGRRGRRPVKSFADDDMALRYIRALLARRGTAERRLGVGYVAQTRLLRLRESERQSVSAAPGCTGRRPVDLDLGLTANTAQFSGLRTGMRPVGCRPQF